MNNMTKIVNINARFPIKSITPPIYGTLTNVEMSTSNILKCLMRHAIIEEVLPDGSTIPLNYKNYYTDNYKKETHNNKNNVSSANDSKIINEILNTEEIINEDASLTEDSADQDDTDIEDEEGDEEGSSPTETSNNQNRNNNQNHNRNKKRKKRH